VKRRVRASLSVFIWICSAWSCTQTQDAKIAHETPPGVTDSEIVLGSSLPFKGHASYLGIETFRGYMSYIQHVNENGGVHGRSIRVIAYDDSYDPPICLLNTQRLIVDDQVFALFSYVGTPTTLRVLPLVEEAKIPLLGVFTGANALREPLSRYVINIRASYYQEAKVAIRHLIEDLGISKIAVFYQYDAFGFDGLTGVDLALKDFGMAPVARGSYVRGAIDVEEGLHKIMASGAEAVVMVATYEPCANFITLAKQQGFNPIFFTGSYVGAEELARRLTPDLDLTVIMSQVVPPLEGPDSSALLGSAAEYMMLLAHYFPEDKPNVVGWEGYLNARVLVEGLKRAGRELTREGFIDAIESIAHYPLAGDMIISFGPTDHQGLDSVYFTHLENGLFVLIEDWKTIRKALKREDAILETPANPMEGAGNHEKVQ
jgi:branched-chain amino acid transport system substrate-binding protein